MSKNLIFVIVVLLSGCGGGSNSVVLDVVSNGWESVETALKSSIAVTSGMLTFVATPSD